MELTNTEQNSDGMFTEINEGIGKLTDLESTLRLKLEVAKILAEFEERPEELKEGLRYLYSEGYFQQVINAGLVLVEHDVADADIFCLLGQCFFLTQESDQAIKSFESARILNPVDTSITVNLAACLASAGDLSSAKALLTDTINEEPDHALAHFNLGLLYQTEGNTEAADASFYEAEIINPSLVSEIKKAKND